MPANKDTLIKNLGMYWEGERNFQIPQGGTVNDSLAVLRTNIAQITYGSLSTLEKNPADLPQTRTILAGQSVQGISIDDLMQVKRYGDAVKTLMLMVKNGEFGLNEKTACELHGVVAKEEALTWGKFRNSQVTIATIDQYTPPRHDALAEIAERGFKYLRDNIESPKERAVATFLYMSRAQFFHDANKRTASLMMNGILVKEAYYPISLTDRNSEEFHTKLSEFYNTGNATKMMDFFERSVRELYPDLQQSQEQSKTPDRAQVQTAEKKTPDRGREIDR